MYLLSFDWESGVNFEGKLLNFVHGSFEYFEFLIDFADVVFHLSDGVDAADEFAVVLEDERLYLMIMDFDLLIDLIIFAD